MTITLYFVTLYIN